MVDYETGMADEVKIEDAGDSSDYTQYLGRITAASHTVSPDVTQGYTIGDWKPKENIDGLTTIEGSVTCSPPNLKLLQLVGTYSEDTDEGIYSISLDKILGKTTFKQQKIGDGGVATLSGFKFGSYTMRVGEDQDLEIELSGQGDDFDLDTSTTITTPSANSYDTKKYYDVKVSIDGDTVGSAASVTADYNRDLEAIKGMEDNSSRTPTEIIEKNFDHSFDIDINITNADAYSKMLDDASSPYTIQDERSDQDIVVTIDTSAGNDTYTMKNCRMEEISSDMDDSKDKRIATIRGVCRDVEISGDT